jgi:hypothetical protein
MVPPHPILIEWRNEELLKGNRAKAVKIQRVINKRKYLNTRTSEYVET